MLFGTSPTWFFSSKIDALSILARLHRMKSPNRLRLELGLGCGLRHGLGHVVDCGTKREATASKCPKMSSIGMPQTVARRGKKTRMKINIP